ncbi:TNF receptor-associated factor 4 isoform X2 [Oopsacas minuta]|uniref:TNF receptor-associated factor 4 isoform X2 n=1 Tax=Oopsacas minuta TaxID=111878 RepID=A0AAV7JEM5_9METZ|nr:TNF receptor-associated factor 4 isoform X2 [Oopsacas minuta]
MADISLEIIKSEKGTDLCRLRRGGSSLFLGFRKDILTENLSDRESVLLICKRCQGILREACISSTGEQFCSCCTKGEEQTHPNIYVRDTVLSLKCSCPLFQRGCEWLGTLGECENHLDVCSHVHEKCKLGCDIVLPRHELSIHVSEQCNFREIPCEHCQTDFKVCDMPDHIEKCPKMPLKCELKCGTVVCRKDMAHHLEKDCGRVVEKCKLGCGIELPRDELDMHVNEKCVQRMIPCEYCHIDFKACEMTIHLVECPKMPLTCELGCGTVACRNNMAQHIEEECVEKMIECPFIKYKCEVGLIKRKELNQHLERRGLNTLN